MSAASSLDSGGTRTSRTHFSVDPWDPSYGLAYSTDSDSDGAPESTAELALDVEREAGDWAPVLPPTDPETPSTVFFIDGVRRIDARVWMHNDVAQPAAGIAASYAAGLVRCNDTAEIIGLSVGRGLFTADPKVTDIVAGSALYSARPAAGGGPDELSLALQRQLTLTEIQLASSYRSQHPTGDDLLVVDGPLRGRTHLDRAVGYIKTHHTSYLPSDQSSVVARLSAGQRTPVFTIGTSWIRHSWYLALPSESRTPWAGVVRVECSADLRAADAIRLANVTARLLPKFASTPHKDPRAPQNLVPIGGLERQLRHRLGDQQVLYRSLRMASGYT